MLVRSASEPVPAVDHGSVDEHRTVGLDGSGAGVHVPEAMHPWLDLAKPGEQVLAAQPESAAGDVQPASRRCMGDQDVRPIGNRRPAPRKLFRSLEEGLAGQVRNPGRPVEGYPLVNVGTIPKVYRVLDGGPVGAELLQREVVIPTGAQDQSEALSSE